MRKEVTVCNVCQDPSRPVSAYRVGKAKAIEDVDLCQEHGAPIEAILATVYAGKVEPTEAAKAAKAAPRKQAAKAATGGARRRGTPVMTLEQIEEAKAAQRA